MLEGLASFEETPRDLAKIELDLTRQPRFAPFPVAELSGVAHGHARAGRYRAGPAYRFSLEDTVYVDASHEGRGLGNPLLAALAARCGELGYRRMVAVVGDSANHASIRLHDRRGFRTCSAIPSVGFKLGRWVDSTLMERPFGPGDTRLPD